MPWGYTGYKGAEPPTYIFSLCDNAFVSCPPLGGPSNSYVANDAGSCLRSYGTADLVTASLLPPNGLTLVFSDPASPCAAGGFAFSTFQIRFDPRSHPHDVYNVVPQAEGCGIRYTMRTSLAVVSVNGTILGQ